MNLIIKLFEKFFGYSGLYKISNELNKLNYIQTQIFLESKLQQQKYQNNLRLNKYEFQSHSQNGEDGMIHEIFNRIGLTNKYFIEFGVGNGLQNNSAYLLLNGWKGIWIEADDSNALNINSAFKSKLDSGQLILRKQFIYKDNLKSILDEVAAPLEPDLLSIDIDGNDYWVWKYLDHYSPRVVIVEYNGALGPYSDWKMDYNEKHFWNGSKGIHFGVSLKALEKLGSEKGYSLVGCNLTGVNAFFVRNDLVRKGQFCEPFTSENHFEKPLYFMEHTLGHKRVNSIFGQ
jgi:hypothetical protein